MTLDLKKALYLLSLALPNFVVFNYLVAGVYFVRANGRLPRRRDAANATLNDFIFHNMIGSKWGVLAQFCVDKEFAKIFAAESSNVKTAKTHAVFSIDECENVGRFIEWLKPFLGRRLIAKPTHGSGKVLFLDRNVGENEIRKFFAYSCMNFFYLIRETQYKNLERKILLEENISADNNLNDYKFFCARGRVLFCEVDVDRFTDHKRAICTVPAFEIVPVQTKHLEIPDRVQKPPCFDRMVEIAASLSKPFEFVRVDLYNVNGDVYFGEYTFTPGGAADNFSSEKFGIEILTRIRACHDRGEFAFADDRAH